MAKDPAFLFYPNDWLGGTLTFSRAQKGAYIDLLMCQFNQGHMSIQDIKDVLGSDFPMWDSKIKKKFCEDEEGNFYNERLDFELIKRKKFTEHQKENGSKGGRPLKPKNNPKETHGLTQTETQPITQTITQHKTQGKPKQKPLENENENTNCSIGNVSNSEELEPNYRKEEIDNSLPKNTEPIGETDKGNYVNPTVVQQTMLQIYRKHKPEYRGKLAVDGYYVSEIACKIADFKGWPRESINNGKFTSMVETWELILAFTKTHTYSYSRTLKDLAGDNEWDRLISIFQAYETNQGNSGKGQGYSKNASGHGKSIEFD